MRAPIRLALAIGFSIAALLLGSACRHFSVNSRPPGADVLIDGQKVGLTPYRKAVGRWDMKDLNVRLEKEGYQSYEVSAQPRLSVGSIIVSILTTGGISMLFLSPQVYQPVTVDLLAAGQSETPQMRAKRLLDSGAITAGEYRKLIATQDQEDRIQELQNLKDRGLLTDQEFQRLTEPKPVP